MSRNNSIDNIRLLAIFCIIVLHSFPFFYIKGLLHSTSIAINQLTRFAVPCFFVISGFLYAQRVWSAGATPSLRRSASRIALLYLFWCVIYILPYNIALISSTEPDAHFQYARYHLATWIDNPEDLLLKGSKGHLWFLPALLCATVLCTPFIAYRRIGAMLVVVSLIFVIALLGGPYKNTLIDFDLPIAARNGPFFSSIFFALGAALAQMENRRHFLVVGILLTVAGAIGQVLETFRMVWAGYAPGMPVYPDFVISTLPFGVGVAMIGLSGAAAHDNKPWLWGLGRYTLGIYALHLFVMDFFIPIPLSWATQIWWQLLKAPIVFALTAALVLCISRVQRLRPLIS